MRSSSVDGARTGQRSRGRGTLSGGSLHSGDCLETASQREELRVKMRDAAATRAPKTEQLQKMNTNHNFLWRRRDSKPSARRPKKTLAWSLFQQHFTHVRPPPKSCDWPTKLLTSCHYWMKNNLATKFRNIFNYMTHRMCITMALQQKRSPSVKQSMLLIREVHYVLYFQTESVEIANIS